jgi:hypothetical protein
MRSTAAEGTAQDESCGWYGAEALREAIWIWQKQAWQQQIDRQQG